MYIHHIYMLYLRIINMYTICAICMYTVMYVQYFACVCLCVVLCCRERRKGQAWNGVLSAICYEFPAITAPYSSRYVPI